MTWLGWDRPYNPTPDDQTRHTRAAAMIEHSWKYLSSELLRAYRTVRVREDRYRFSPTGKEAGFVVCESADWVLVIALTPDQEVVLVSQFRHGRGDVVLEIPGGVMEVGEAPAEAAARELQEETGFVARQLKVYPPFLPNPALNSAECHVVLATGCTRSSAPNPDPFELLEVELRPVSRVPDMIRNGELMHALTIAAFSVFDVHARSETKPA